MSWRRNLVFLSLASVFAVVFIGHAAGEAASSSERNAAVGTRALGITVYFLTEDAAAPLGVRRTINHEPASSALGALLEGPTAAERKGGITTAIPDRTRLVSLTLKGRERVLAVVNLSGLPPARGRQSEEATLGTRVRVITQIARTLIGLSGIASVKIRAEGNTWDLWAMNGRIVDTETDYERLRAWILICGGRSPTERKLGLSRCFSALP